MSLVSMSRIGNRCVTVLIFQSKISGHGLREFEPIFRNGFSACLRGVDIGKSELYHVNFPRLPTRDFQLYFSLECAYLQIISCSRRLIFRTGSRDVHDWLRPLLCSRPSESAYAVCCVTAAAMRSLSLSKPRMQTRKRARMAGFASQPDGALARRLPTRRCSATCCALGCCSLWLRRVWRLSGHRR